MKLIKLHEDEIKELKLSNDLLQKQFEEAS